MYYLDSQRTVTRRDSSLILPKRNLPSEDRTDADLLSTRVPSTARLGSASGGSLFNRPKGSIQKELVTLLFESMLDNIVESWEVIVQQKPEESSPNMEFAKSPSELTFSSKKKNKLGAKPKAKRSRSKLELSDTGPVDPLLQSWWSGPDEKALIRFRNGNIFEGHISMKCMHGEGRFQWADGTVYLGNFKDNEINGKGFIQWKDDTWYEGDFMGNLRHGHGLYVDSRKQRSYTGGWDYGTKHGQGVIYYSKTFRNSYDGEWIHNVRHGYGCREYCDSSGYKGEWDLYIREGKGMMIWPNHDYYRGDWKTGVMSGYGIYIWDTCFNNSMSLPSLTAYRGYWEKGKRNGYGVLNLGSGYGSHYKGDFKDNKKHGVGKFVTNNGLILQGKRLFVDDNLGPKMFSDDDDDVVPLDNKYFQTLEPFQFDIFDDSAGLSYHIENALAQIDKQVEIRATIINEYIENNKDLEIDSSKAIYKDENVFAFGELDYGDLIKFEEISLHKSLRCYESELKNIYYKYATICNVDDISFSPVMIRLYLWQLYFDCNIHQKGLTLIEIDNIFFNNPEWIARTPHNPFEKIYFWQFLHSLISVASKLYAKRHIPTIKPDTILGCAFRTFMDRDVLPGTSHSRGRLVNGFGRFVPLGALYDLYRRIGEPHTIRAFLCAMRPPAHDLDHPQREIIDASDACLPVGRNAYVIGDAMTFMIDEPMTSCSEILDSDEECHQLKLFNFGNLSCKAVIKIFAQIFPHIYVHNKIMNLDTEITFFEYFEAFIACAEASIRVKEEELRWREQFSVEKVAIPTKQKH